MICKVGSHYQTSKKKWILSDIFLIQPSFFGYILNIWNNWKLFLVFFFLLHLLPSYSLWLLLFLPIFSGPVFSSVQGRASYLPLWAVVSFLLHRVQICRIFENPFHHYLMVRNIPDFTVGPCCARFCHLTSKARVCGCIWKYLKLWIQRYREHSTLVLFILHVSQPISLSHFHGNVYSQTFEASFHLFWVFFIHTIKSSAKIENYVLIRNKYSCLVINKLVVTQACRLSDLVEDVTVF